VCVCVCVCLGLHVCLCVCVCQKAVQGSASIMCVLANDRHMEGIEVTTATQ